MPWSTAASISARSAQPERSPRNTAPHSAEASSGSFRYAASITDCRIVGFITFVGAFHTKTSPGLP